MLLDFYPLFSVPLKTDFPERDVHARNGFFTFNPERLESLSRPGNFIRERLSLFREEGFLTFFDMFVLQKLGSLWLPATGKNS